MPSTNVGLLGQEQLLSSWPQLGTQAHTHKYAQCDGHIRKTQLEEQMSF